MNEVDMKVLGLHEIIRKTKTKTKEWKALAITSLFASTCYCLGTKNLELVDTSQAIASNLVWLVAFVAIIVFYYFDVRCVKHCKACEIRIYDLEVEDLTAKKEVAEITGQIMSNNLFPEQLDKPDEKIVKPVTFYGIMLGIDVVFRLYLFVKGVI